MSTAEVVAVPRMFADAARRAHSAGFRVVEIHAAHGYLLHEFLSPATNTRTDTYGADRTLLLAQVVAAVREVWPDELPLFLRVSAVDWIDGGLTVEDAIEVADRVKELGVDLVDVSSGGLPSASVEPGPCYQVPFAAAIRQASRLPVAAVGLIETAEQVEEVLGTGQADAVFSGRAFLRDPYWARHVLSAGGTQTPWPDQYAWTLD